MTRNLSLISAVFGIWFMTGCVSHEIVNTIDTPNLPINTPTKLPPQISDKGNKPKKIPKFSAKFNNDWTKRFPTKLASDQEAYCLSKTNKKSFKSFEEWVFIVNTAPVSWNKGKSILGVETPCAVFSGIINQNSSEINLTLGDIIIAEGHIKGDNVINFWKLLKVN